MSWIYFPVSCFLFLALSRPSVALFSLLSCPVLLPCLFFFLFLVLPRVLFFSWSRRKRASHSSYCHSSWISFVPLEVETLGGWSCEAVETIKAIGCLQGQRLGLPWSETTSHIFQQLAIRLWQGNASMWAMRILVFSPMIDGVMWHWTLFMSTYLSCIWHGLPVCLFIVAPRQKKNNNNKWVSARFRR